MAIFNINIQDNTESPIIDSSLKIYYGSVDIYPTNSTELINSDFKVLDKEELQLDFLPNKKYFIALPNTVQPFFIVNIDNIFENINDQYTIDSQNLPITVNGEEFIYNIYKFNNDRPFINPFRVNIKISKI